MIPIYIGLNYPVQNGNCVKPLNRFLYIRASHEIALAKDICAPPIKYTTQLNRMSPAGTSMFYAACTKKQVYSMLYPDDKAKLYYTPAEFKTNST
jgi:hypothetical protein